MAKIETVENSLSRLSLLREPEVAAITKLSRPQRFKMERRGQFPKRVPIVPGGRHHGWYAGEIRDWLEGRGEERDTLEASRTREARQHVAA